MSNVSPGSSQLRSKSLSAYDSPSYHFPIDVLIHVLYGKKSNEPVDVKTLRQTDRPKTYCDVCKTDRQPNGCRLHATQKTADQEEQGLSYAIKSFPPEVQLCTSSIPGARYGVCAKRLIPEGTWIGPYEGKRVKPEDLISNRDNSFLWEIYDGDQASCYIDGSDENVSSWMRFIHCARCKQEQNLYAFQYLGNVFYRSFKEILPGTEMLVWYDEKYPQHMGIPVGLQEIEFVNAIDIENNNAPTSTTSQINLEQQRRDHHFNMMHRVLPSMQSEHAPNQTIISSHDTYGLPISSLDDPARLPASAYGYPVPVNISAGIPTTARMPGRVHTGITGIVARDQEASTTISTSHYGNGRMTSPHIPANIESIETDTRSYHHVHTRPSSHPTMSNKLGNIYSEIRPSSSCSNVTAGSAHNDVITSLHEERELRQTVYHGSVSEEALRERGYSVKDDARRTRSLRKRHSPSRSDVQMNREDEDNVIEKRARLPSDEQQHSDMVDDNKSNCSDSNSSNISTKELVGSAADEISMWRCRQCQKTFTQRVQLQVHICPNQPFKPYRCGQCEVSFDTAPELRSHVDTHASEKPFKCGFCSRSFAGATTLNNHIRAHMGKKPFHCECGKSFAQPVQLARHQKTPGECEHYSQLQIEEDKDKACV